MMHCDIEAPWRAAARAALREEHFDVLVIGGGINGAGIVRDAALRGLRVALVEQGDFASGTSSRSSKLIHGGLRYLQQGDLRLVLEATRERERLRRLAPHLVRPMRVVFPIYRGGPVGRWTLKAGLLLYDLLAGIRNVKRHAMLGAAAARAAEPTLRGDGLVGAGEYWDCWTNDARLVVETLLSATQAGAVALSYARVSGFLNDRGRIVGARLADAFGGPEIDVRARVVVNAAGPWVDEVCALDAPAPPRLRLTKGAHVVVPRARVGNRAAWVLHARRDGRVMFVIPWGEQTLIGTTDTDHAGGASTPPTVEPDDVAYLLETVNYYCPSAELTSGDVVGAYAGLRPLVAPESAGGAPSSLSREEDLFVSPAGLVSIAGGKLTTYRVIAAAVVDRVVAVLRDGGDPRPIGPSPTARLPLPGGTVDPQRLSLEALARDGHGMAGAALDHLAGRYGERLGEVLAAADEDPSLRTPLLPPFPDPRAEVAIAVDREWAVTLEDVLVRRTQLGLLDAQATTSVAEDVARMMGARLGWSEPATRAAARAYVEAVERNRRGWG
jgi:glycerol-3-phosphate dehydrogenase